MPLLAASGGRREPRPDRGGGRGRSRRRRWPGRGGAGGCGSAARRCSGSGSPSAVSRIDFERALREITLPLRHDDIIRQQAADKHLDPALIAAVIYAESRFRDQESQRRRARADADHPADGRT